MNWQLAFWVLSDAHVLGDEISYDALVLACSQAEKSLRWKRARVSTIYRALAISCEAQLFRLSSQDLSSSGEELAPTAEGLY